MTPLIPLYQKKGRVFRSVIFLTFILGYFGATAADVSGAKANTPFAAFKPDVDLDIEDGEFELKIPFTLGTGNNGINLQAETVILKVNGGRATFSIKIPPGSFKKDGSGHFTFQGTIDKARMLASIRPLRDSTFEFEIEGDGVNLKGVANPVTVSLMIGDDGGSASVRAKIE